LGQGSPELKTYLSVGQVALLSVAVPYYGRLAARLHRRALLNVVTYFFVACLAVFYVLGQAGVPIGVAYFLWIGVFNLMIVAQFWSFANDLYTREEGERLFPIVGFGASLGAVLGAIIAERLIQPLGVYQLLLVGAVLLAAQLQVTNYVDRHTSEHEEAPKPPSRTAEGCLRCRSSPTTSSRSCRGSGLC
jgi:AAA family ATP:ADP antiporter